MTIVFSDETLPQPKFRVGNICATPPVLRQVRSDEIVNALYRHASGDWGDIQADDARNNNEALHTGGRLFSVYHSVRGCCFWIITEADRSTTTILLPEDY